MAYIYFKPIQQLVLILDWQFMVKQGLFLQVTTVVIQLIHSKIVPVRKS